MILVHVKCLLAVRDGRKCELVGVSECTCRMLSECRGICCSYSILIVYKLFISVYMLLQCERY